jgi:hypothetical protein
MHSWVRRLRRSSAVACCLLLLTPIAGAQEIDADTREWARKLGYRGVEAFQHGDFGTAAEKLEKAFKILAAPSLGLWSARTFEKLGWLVEASRRYQDVIKLQPIGGDIEVQRKALQDAAPELAALEARIPILTIVIEGVPLASVEVEIDNNPVPPAALKGGIPTNPGKHRLTARRADRVLEETLTLRESERRQVLLHFSPSLGVGQAEAVPSALTSVRAGTGEVEAQAGASVFSQIQRPAGWISIGVGTAALVVGGVAGFMALRDRANLGSSGCDLATNTCSNAPSDQLDAYNDLRTISSVGLLSGVVVAGAGLALVLTARDSTKPMTLHAGPGALTVRAAF